MKKYFKYTRYLLKHIHYVRVECFKQGLYFQGIVHDWHKWLPEEFIPYANFFYSKDKQPVRKEGYYKPTDTGDKKFDFAWLLHQKRGKHHWQWWVIPEEESGVKIFPMKERYWKEMICDWVGAGKAQGFSSPKNDKYKETRTWYNKNKNKMQLHPETRIKVEKFIGIK